MFSTLIEIGIIALFILNIYLAKKTKKLDLLVISTIFAALFENLHVILFQDYTGGYYYSNQFLFLIYKVPLFIILSWGIIILNAYLVATKLTNKVARIFLTPVLVIMIDFALEFFAARQGYWVWVGYNETQGLFGVPASNFLGWILITLTLILCYEEIEEKWIVPIVAYILFVFITTAESFMIGMLGIDINQQTNIVWGMIALLLALTVIFWNVKQKEEVEDKHVKTALISRLVFYVFSIVSAITNKEIANMVWPILAYAYAAEALMWIATNYEKWKRKNKTISSFSS